MASLPKKALTTICCRWAECMPDCTASNKEERMSRSLLILPDDTAKPILDAIDAAAKSIRIKMFALSEPSILESLIRAHDRGVKIRVMLNPARRSGEVQNKGS